MRGETHEGPVHECGSTLRYRSNNACVACTRSAAVAQRRTRYSITSRLDALEQRIVALELTSNIQHPTQDPLLK
jgi:hypothetical protein